MHAEGFVLLKQGHVLVKLIDGFSGVPDTFAHTRGLTEDTQVPLISIILKPL